jgi:hypothetical protein
VNIFVLSFKPEQAARALCDKHVPKMLLETAQLLCSPFEPGTAPYKRTHYNHPCAVWARESQQNYAWLLLYGDYLADEYTQRFGKKHKSKQVLQWCLGHCRNLHPGEWAMGSVAIIAMWRRTGKLWRMMCTPFVQAMPEQYRHSNPVTAYRAYYIGEKARFAKWERGRNPPPWWPKEN